MSCSFENPVSQRRPPRASIFGVSFPDAASAWASVTFFFCSITRVAPASAVMPLPFSVAHASVQGVNNATQEARALSTEIRRASCRERVLDHV